MANYDSSVTVIKTMGAAIVVVMDQKSDVIGHCGIFWTNEKIAIN